MIRPGEEWGRPTTAAPEVVVAGGDLDLAAAVTAHPGALVRFHPGPTSHLAGAVGLDRETHLGVELDIDALRIDGAGEVAVNMVVVGRPPDALGVGVRSFGANVRIDGKPVFHGPCTTVVIATGQFRRRLDVVPRGHPGDGRAEIQVYAVPRGQRRALRGRLATGTHVPHPGIVQRSGRHVEVSLDRRVAVEIDGRSGAPADRLEVTVVPAAYRLLL